jgi:hypothetical protein
VLRFVQCHLCEIGEELMGELGSGGGKAGYDVPSLIHDLRQHRHANVAERQPTRDRQPTARYSQAHVTSRCDSSNCRLYPSSRLW